jgi:hypothetical protein
MNAKLGKEYRLMIYGNRALRRVFGHEREDVIGTRFYSFVF